FLRHVFPPGEGLEGAAEEGAAGAADLPLGAGLGDGRRARKPALLPPPAFRRGALAELHGLRHRTEAGPERPGAFDAPAPRAAAETGEAARCGRWARALRGLRGERSWRG